MTGDVERHEAALARSIGAAHAVSFGHARQALVAILAAAGLERGDGVVLAPLTCKVVPLALAALGLEPVYADIDADTLNLSAARAAEASTVGGGALRAVLFQHTYGSALGLEAVEAFAARQRQVLVEDCAQCLPSRDGAPSASRDALPGSRRAAIFSNNLMKPLPAGSGGVATTNDEALAAGIRRAREPLAAPTFVDGASQSVQLILHHVLLRPSTYWPLFALARRFGSHYEMLSLDAEVRREVRDVPGRISARQARAGSRRLRDVDELAEHRRATCAAYATELAAVENVVLPRTSPDAPLCYFPVLVPDKPALLRRAEAVRVELIPWPVSTPIYPVENERELATYGYVSGSCPAAEDVARRLVGLPTHARLGRRHRDAVVRLVREHAEGR
jgi:dTDP-4-amino-4,6-dideoxygalactose transaminase